MSGGDRRVARGGSERARRGLPRAADVALALLGLALGSPLLALCAVAIKLDSRGPVLYRQRRVGAGGEVFELFKLRTMRGGSDPAGVGTAVTADDPRVTRVGRLLRRFSLDELPNLLNVLRGEMAIVGPRATLPAQVEMYTPRQRRRLELRPGVTGWAQIHGRAGIPWEERIELDVWYVEHRSLRLDLRILARTPLVLLGGIGGEAPDPFAGSPPDSPLRRAAEREAAEREAAGGKR
jgi:lipopolysaccharide/colanic/teichoic acid biosynthesis glycosyltransferase